MRVLDKADPDHPVIREVPEEIGRAWLTQTDRFEPAPEEGTEPTAAAAESPTPEQKALET